MKVEKFFEVAKAKGIAQSQIQIGRSTSLNFTLFHHEVEKYKISHSQGVTACGIYNGKFGIGRTEKLGKDTFDFLTNQILTTASFIEEEAEKEIFPGSEKYHKKNVFNPALDKVSPQEKLALLHKIEDLAYAADPRITDVPDVVYAESVSESEFYNSFGLKLKQKSNYFYIVLGVKAEQNGEIKTAYNIVLENDLSKVNPEAFVKKAVDDALAKFGGAPCVSGKYPTVLHSDIMADLLEYFLSSASSDEVQRQSSFLIGKLNQKIASSKLTIEERPLEKNIFFSYFDSEGVATQNKQVVKNGVLKTYFYNLETAKKDGVASTGNGRWEGNKIGIGFSNIFVKPGKQSFEEMIAPIKEGVYITEIAGLGTGMNAQSGDFSCQADGFMIRDGKVAEPLNLITLSGNLLQMLKDLKEFDSRVELKTSSVSVADAYIKSMSIGGK
ncbi:MAG: TldD/PmbA family protein [Bacilli bacterium]|nr:TldD/PmbA family protein [Bacilli bacterium]